MILEPTKTKSVTVSTFPPTFCHEVMGMDAMIFISWMLSQLFHSPLSHSSRGSLVPLCFLPLGWYHLHIWDYWYFSQQSWFQLMIHPAQHFSWCTLLQGLILSHLLLWLSHEKITTGKEWKQNIAKQHSPNKSTLGWLVGIGIPCSAKEKQCGPWNSRSAQVQNAVCAHTKTFSQFICSFITSS